MLQYVKCTKEKYRFFIGLIFKYVYIFGKDKYTPSDHLFLEYRALNIYKLNIHQVLTFMFKTEFNLNPVIFSEQFSKINHKYNT